MEQIVSEKSSIVVYILGTPYFVEENTEALESLNADGECQAYSKTIQKIRGLLVWSCFIDRKARKTKRGYQA